jgi:hypothetical protein
VKAEIQLAQWERDAQDAQLAIERTQIGFGVWLFAGAGAEGPEQSG